MIKRTLLFLLMVTTLLLPQLKEMEVKPTENRGGIPIFRDYPDKAGIIFYAQFNDLSFYSSYGIVKVMDESGGKFIVIVEPVKQTLEVRAPGFKTEMIKLSDLQPRDVKYYEVLPKKEEGIQGVTEVGITFQISPADAIILLDRISFPNNQTAKVSIGTHTLKIEKPGYSTYEKDISITPDQTFFKIDLPKVQLSPVTIRSTPSNATVYINNENKGTTEVGFFLYSGVYNIRLELPNHVTITEKLEVMPSSDKTRNIFSYNFVLDKGTLQLSINPFDALITLNGNPVKTGSSELTPGKYNLEAKSNLYDAYREEIEIIRGITTKREINLSKNTGVLSLEMTPKAAIVSINKEIRSGNNFELAPGIYEVEVSAETYHPEIMTVQIEKGVTQKRSVTLIQKVGSLQFTIKPLDAMVILSQNSVEKFTWSGMNLLESLPEGIYELKATSKGYKTIKKQISIFEGKHSVENIEMTEGSDSPKGMVFVEGGTFTMGSNDGYSNEKPIHQVTLNNFLIGESEVSQKIWNGVMGYNPSSFKSDDHPVETVAWYEIIQFCNKLSEKEGLQKSYSGSGDKIICDFTANGYRLPTEAEWEYAARGGNRSARYSFSGGNDLDDIGWYAENSESQTHEVATKQPNELGIYDMSGNVSEWCLDWYGKYDSNNQTDPKGPYYGSARVLRGGGWGTKSESSRVTFRSGYDPYKGRDDYGFRLARTK